VAWKRAGWTVDTEAWLEWIRLGDLEGVEFQDGPAAGVHLDWRRDHGGFGGGLTAGRAALAGDPTRISALVGGWGMGRSVGWSADATVGLTDSAPDLGVTVTLRFR
jgi:hypothetical protein